MGGINTYGYALQNSLLYTDPFGLISTLDLCKNPRNAGACQAAGIIPKPKLLRIPKPKKPKNVGEVVYTCRATTNQHCQDGGNQDVKTAFGIATAKSIRKARTKAKQEAKRKLGQQAKHDSCVCVTSKGEVIRTTGH